MVSQRGITSVFDGHSIKRERVQLKFIITKNSKCKDFIMP